MNCDCAPTASAHPNAVHAGAPAPTRRLDKLALLYALLLSASAASAASAPAVPTPATAGAPVSSATAPKAAMPANAPKAATPPNAANAGNPANAGSAANAPSAADLAAGQRTFTLCASCHQIGGKAGAAFGPQLTGIVGRPAGATNDYAYSPAMKASRIVWTEQNLAAFLRDPGKVVPGTKMRFWGLSDEQQIARLIAYMKSVK
jgi:cytochrome c